MKSKQIHKYDNCTASTEEFIKQEWLKVKDLMTHRKIIEDLFST